MTLAPDHVILIEGIHGLNPALVPAPAARIRLPRLRLPPHAAESRSAQPRGDDRLPPDPPTRPRRGHPRLQRPTRCGGGPPSSTARSSTSSRIRSTATRSSIRRSSTSSLSFAHLQSRCCCRSVRRCRSIWKPTACSRSCNGSVPPQPTLCPTIPSCVSSSADPSSSTFECGGRGDRIVFGFVFAFGIPGPCRR